MFLLKRNFLKIYNILVSLHTHEVSVGVITLSVNMISHYLWKKCSKFYLFGDLNML